MGGTCKLQDRLGIEPKNQSSCCGPSNTVGFVFNITKLKPYYNHFQSEETHSTTDWSILNLRTHTCVHVAQDSLCEVHEVLAVQYEFSWSPSETAQYTHKHTEGPVTTK